MPNPKNSQRLEELLSLELLDSLPEKEYEDITQLAAQLCGVPIALISLVTDTRQFFKSHHGLDINETPVEQSFCAHAIMNPNSLFIVKDAREDPRFSDNLLVTDKPHIVFYAGVPLVTGQGNALGTLCVMDQKPRKLDEAQTRALQALARQVIKLFELRSRSLQLKEHKRKLDNESQRLHNIIEATQVGTWEWNVKTGEVKINERWARMIGYSKKELEPLSIESWYKVVHPEDRKLSDHKLQQCFDKKLEYYDIECRLIHKDGHNVWINDRGKVIKWTEDGEPLLMAGTHTDITRRKMAEIQFKTIADNIPGTVFRYKLFPDGSDQLQYVSDGASKLWGISTEEAMANNDLIWGRYDERDLRAHLQSIRDSARDESFWKHEWRYHHPEGTLRWHRGAGFPTRMNDGSTIWDSFIIDITEEQRSKQELNNALQALQERVKEQECLNKITQLSNQNLSVKELLEQSAALLPQGWQYPDHTSACITYGNQTFKTKGYKKTRWIQSTKKKTSEDLQLNITVAYHKKLPAADEGPFLKEERQLIEAIANTLVLSIDRITSAKNKALILASTQEGIYGIDAAGQCTFMNPAGARLLGYDEAECLGKNMHELVHYQKPDGSPFPEDECPIYKSKRSGKGYQMDEGLFFRKDGSEFWVRYSSTPIINDGRVDGAVIVFNDITEKLEARRQLVQREKRFKALVQEGSELIAIIDTEGSFKYTSPNFEDFLGKSPDQLEGTNAFQFVHPDDKEGIWNDFLKLHETKQVKTQPYRLHHHHYGWRWIQSTGTNLLKEEAIQGFVINNVDVTDIVEAKAKLEESEARYRGFYESQTNYVLRTDMEGRYTYVNKKFMEDFGWLHGGEEVIGTSCFPSICEYHHQKVINTVEKCIAQPEKVFKIEIDKPTRNGGTVTTLWDFICVVDAHGAPSELQCVGIDITDRIRFENALKESNERFELITQASSECICDLNPSTNELYVSDGFTRLFGFKVKSLAENKALINSLIHPDDKDEVLQKFNEGMADPHTQKMTLNYRMRKATGDYAYIEDQAIFIRNEAGEAHRVLGVINDITAEYYYKELDRIEREIMQHAITPGVLLKDVMDRYMKNLEELLPGMKATVLKVEDNKVKKLSAPSMPEGYTNAIDGASIGPKAGSCGTAAYTAREVIAENIWQDPRWENYRHLAEEYGFAACWSVPIFNAEDEVVATFANYYEKPRKPSAIEQQAIARSQRILSIILIKFEYVNSIKESNERYTLVNKATNDAIYDWDVKKDRFFWGDGMRRTFGHKVSDTGFSLNDWEALVHPNNLERTRKNLDLFLKDKSRDRWAFEYRFQRGNGTYAWVDEIGYLLRDEEGRPERMIGVLRDETKAKEAKIQQAIKQEVASCFIEDLPLHKVLHNVLDYLAGFGQFDLAEIWMTGNNGHNLHQQARVAATDIGKTFYQCKESKVSKFAKGEGLPGKIWKKQKSLVWKDIDASEAFIRHEAAQKAGIKGSMGLPLFHNEQLVGVLLFGSSQNEAITREKLSPFHSLSAYLGAEVLRKQQEEQMRLLFESAPEIIAILSPDKKFTHVNPAFCEITGYTEEELTSQSYEHFIHPNDLAATKKVFNKTLKGKQQANNFINRWQTKPGEYIWLSWYTSTIFGEEGQAFAFARDVSEMIRLQELLDTATSLSRVGAWEVDLIKDTVYWSSTTREIHEASPDYEPQLASAIELFHPDYHDRVKAAVKMAIDHGEPWDEEWLLVTPIGKERWVRSIAKPEYADGKVVKLVGSFQDIHERKVIEQRLKSISDNIPGVLYQYELHPDGSDQFSSVSAGSSKIFGLSPEECIEDATKVWKGMRAGGNIDLINETIASSAKDLSDLHLNVRYVQPSGNIRYLETYGKPHRKPDGTTVWDCVTLDITEKHELKELANRTSKMARIGSWELDLVNQENDHMYWSPMTREILEVDKNYNPSLTFGFELYEEESQERIRQAVDQLIKTGQTFDEELLITHGQRK
ncbi:MAG: PAS domain S-box protein [Owenweeksia sp.]|nr:PAS domain S-box protein [Owenweeksia sp.]